MTWESSSVVGFNLGSLLQGQMRTAKVKSAYNSLIIDPRRRGPRSIPSTPEDSQPMISYMLVYHPKPLGPIISEL